jgi:hypothetical protein
MSSLRPADLNTVARLFEVVQGPGYVLDFSNRTFADFFATRLDIDIDDDRYADNGTSKGKRLRRFLELVDDPTARRTLSALWERRRDFVSDHEAVPGAEGSYHALLNRLTHGTAAGSAQEPPRLVFDVARIETLRIELNDLYKLTPHPRGYAFEGFLNKLFEAYNLQPREPFRNRGEQIDGSFVHANETYLLEAKWQNDRIGAADLRSFEGKVDDKAPWTRGLFVSYYGFSDDGLYAFGRAKRTLCVSGEDLNDMFLKRIPLDHMIAQKARRAAETGLPFVPVQSLFS